MWFENMDMESVVTPVYVEQLQKLLLDANYEKTETDFLVKGFSKGFELNYKGNRNVCLTSNNLKFRPGVGSKLELWNKVMKEVKDKRFAGPFKNPPFEHFIQSPIGLVPKDGGKKTRLIFHLSHPRSNPSQSVNGCIPKDACRVKYPDFEEAVQRCTEEGVGCRIGKSDMSMAFRNVPMKPTEWALLVMKAFHPVTGELFYFFDKCLPFGSSISCAHFQRISDVIGYLVFVRTLKKNINYLDDYFFAALLKANCDGQVDIFLMICKQINFPVSLEKTFWGTTRLTFLGLLLDTLAQVVCIPEEKVIRALDMLAHLLNPNKKKATVHQIQKLCGFLNFLCRCVVPGRAFLRRLYSTVSSKLKPHHHIRITQEMKSDMQVWVNLLTFPGIFCRPFMDFKALLTAQDINMYSDASRNFKLGFGALCESSWTYGVWDQEFMEAAQPSIEYLELFAVTVAVLKRISRFQNKRIFLFCDNESVVHMLNKSSSTCKNCMVLIRMITLQGLLQNVRIYAKHVRSENNSLADALSRLKLSLFHKLGPHMDTYPEDIPEEIWPLRKIWLW